METQQGLTQQEIDCMNPPPAGDVKATYACLEQLPFESIAGDAAHIKKVVLDIYELGVIDGYAKARQQKA